MKAREGVDLMGARCWLRLQVLGGSGEQLHRGQVDSVIILCEG